MNLLVSVMAIGMLSTNIMPLAELNNTTTEVASIENTNVSYDLNLFSNNGNYDYSYDWQSDNKVQFDIYGNPSNSDYDDFKFLIIKPVLGDIYLYCYWTNPNDFLPIFKNSFVKISMSTEKDLNGSYREDISTYQAELVNSYGTKDVFLKYKISGAYEFDSNVPLRIYVDSLYIEYIYQGKDLDSKNYNCGNYIIFQTNEDGDLVFDYWRKDHVTIIDGKVAAYLVADELVKVANNDNIGSSYNEYSYYLFNTDEDHPITDLISVSYNYELINYDVNYSFDTYRFNNWGQDSHSYNYFCYDGLLSSDPNSIDNPFSNRITNKNLKFSDISYSYKSSSIQTSGTSTVEVDRPLIDWLPLWATQSISYSFDNIQDLSKVDEISNEVEYSTYKDFMTSDSVLDVNGESYQWAFKVGPNTQRSWLNHGSYGYGVFDSETYHGLLTHEWINSNCNEVDQALITHLTFFNDNEYYSLDVLDSPKDTVSIDVQVVPYDDLMDKVFSSTKSFMDLIKSLVSNFKMILSVSLILLITIITFSIVSKVKILLLPRKMSNLKRDSKK